jgi:hypothetical protein
MGRSYFSELESAGGAYLALQYETVDGPSKQVDLL